jgi:hypothetical protein
MSDGHSTRADRGGLSTHILPTSANLVGVCMMTISVVKLLRLHGMAGLIDELLLWDSLLFLLSGALSYASMRARGRAARLESLAEGIFLLGLFVVIAAAALLSYDAE